MNRSDTIRAHGDARQACMTGLIPAQPSFLLAPVFPGCHVILSPCDPSRNRTGTFFAGGRNRTGNITTLCAPTLQVSCGIEPHSASGVVPSHSSPTLKPCVTRTGFRHLRARHRLTIPLRTVKSLPRFPAATGTPEARYCAQGFNVGPPFVGQEPLTRSTEELLCWWPVLISGMD